MSNNDIIKVLRKHMNKDYVEPSVKIAVSEVIKKFTPNMDITDEDIKRVLEYFRVGASQFEKRVLDEIEERLGVENERD